MEYLSPTFAKSDFLEQEAGKVVPQNFAKFTREAHRFPFKM